jgi:hypothetical protein
MVFPHAKEVEDIGLTNQPCKRSKIGLVVQKGGNDPLGVDLNLLATLILKLRFPLSCSEGKYLELVSYRTTLGSKQTKRFSKPKESVSVTNLRKSDIEKPDFDFLDFCIIYFFLYN